MIRFPNQNHSELEREREKLEAYFKDLRRIQAGEGPTEGELALAPLLELWRLSFRPTPILMGLATSHPVLGDGTIQTSELLVFAPDLGWARTRSRFYRLGQTMVGPSVQ